MSTTLYDPSSYEWRPAAVLAFSHMMNNEIDKACKYFSVVEKAVPDLEWVVQNKKWFVEAQEQKDFIMRFIWILKFLKTHNPDLMMKLFDAVPKSMQQHPTMKQLKSQVTPPKVWSKKSVVFFCGASWEEWADPSVVTGIGGSEEAVIYLTRELAKLGWEVTVYNQCGDLEGTYHGVEYKDVASFNVKDTFNYFVSWRHNIFSNVPIVAKKTILWLHDVPSNVSGDRGNLFNKVVVLSNYHKSLLPSSVDNTQIYVSSNGINLEDFELQTHIERNPYRMIYTSSYDRGIEHLLERWSEVKEAVPEAELHLFYGWDTYDAMMKQGIRPKEFRERMTKLMQQPGIFEHGRVGHKQLNKELAKSHFWVYPSHFQEISCISAMKAQAMGCYPVYMNYAALNETVKGGCGIVGDINTKEVEDVYIQRLISCLKSSPKVVIPKEQFGWDKVAQDWTEGLFV
jgi:glycosyltransferase involved in cell wall biosynthesis